MRCSLLQRGRGKKPQNAPQRLRLQRKFHFPLASQTDITVWFLRMLTYKILQSVHFFRQSMTEWMEKIRIRLKYIQMAMISNFNPNMHMISLCIQRTYFKNLNITELWILTFFCKKHRNKAHNFWTQNIRACTYEVKRKLFQFPAKYLSWQQQTSYKLQIFYTTVTVDIEINCI